LFSNVAFHGDNVRTPAALCLTPCCAHQFLARIGDCLLIIDGTRLGIGDGMAGIAVIVLLIGASCSAIDWTY
jgi:hypothetical protein